MKHKSTLLIVGLLVAGCGPAALAQATSAASDCTPTQTNPRQGTLSPNGTATGQTGEPLSDKLARSDGVLCPPVGIDSEMRVPAPDVGTMPVIPPPGSPSGEGSVRPK